jgi:hypothetical protein
MGAFILGFIVGGAIAIVMMAILSARKDDEE